METDETETLSAASYVQNKSWTVTETQEVVEKYMN